MQENKVIDPPYPPDLEAKGWSLDLDYERIEQSDTWALASSDQRPWLLMIWLVSWRQCPVASFPNNDTLIAARIGMPIDQFSAWRDILLAGWQAASDGRVYHKTLTQHVVRMANKRAKDRDRVANFRAKSLGSHEDVDSCNALHARDQRVSSTPTPTPTPKEEISKLSLASTRPVAEYEPEPEKAIPGKPAIPDCPHLEILSLWAEVLPALPQHSPSLWNGARASHLRARWRETASAKGWTTKEQGLAYFRRVFAHVGKSNFLTGRVPNRDPTKRPFLIELEWLVSPGNWAKVLEGKYSEEVAAA